MLSLESIEREARTAAHVAKRLGKKPLSIREYTGRNLREFCRDIPFLGEYVPEGWIAAPGIADLFVDSSGFGDESEAALTLRRFGAVLEGYRKSCDNYGFGIVQAGQFQIYVRVYRPDPRDFTRTGNLTNADLIKVRES